VPAVCAQNKSGEKYYENYNRKARKYTRSTDFPACHVNLALVAVDLQASSVISLAVLFFFRHESSKVLLFIEFRGV
jgi:hypothetical protein